MTKFPVFQGSVYWPNKGNVTTTWWSDGTVTTQYPDGVPCNHSGCLSHITHPCEGCGRKGGKSNG